jgi:hypothetical protein
MSGASFCLSVVIEIEACAAEQRNPSCVAGCGSPDRCGQAASAAAPSLAQKASPTNKPKQAPKVTVIRGKAAEAEMAAMERAAKRQQQSKAKR